MVHGYEFYILTSYLLPQYLGILDINYIICRYVVIFNKKFCLNFFKGNTFSLKVFKTFILNF